MELQKNQNLEAGITTPKYPKLYALGWKMVTASILFWFAYTVTYLFIDGWHLEAISPIEKFLDSITALVFNVGWMFIIIPMFLTIDRDVMKNK